MTLGRGVVAEARKWGRSWPTPHGCLPTKIASRKFILSPSTPLRYAAQKQKALPMSPGFQLKFILPAPVPQAQVSGVEGLFRMTTLSFSVEVY